jgi:hypothetical protein
MVELLPLLRRLPLQLLPLQLQADLASHLVLSLSLDLVPMMENVRVGAVVLTRASVLVLLLRWNAMVDVGSATQPRTTMLPVVFVARPDAPLSFVRRTEYKAV